MRNKICVYPKCKSDTRYSHKEHMNGVFFITFTKPKRSLERCKKWLKFLGRDDYPMERISGDTYLCSKHFIGMKGPSLEYPDLIHIGKLISILKQVKNVAPSIKIPSSSSVLNTVDENQDYEIEIIESYNQTVSDHIQDNGVKSCNHNEIGSVISSAAEDVEQTEEQELQNYTSSPILGSSSVLTSVDQNQVNEIEIIESYIQSAGDAEQIDTRHLHNYTFDQNCIISSTPKCSRKNDEQELTRELSTIDCSEIFMGFNCSLYVNIFKNRNESLGFQSHDGSIHSQKCTLVLQPHQKRRCFFALSIEPVLE